MNLLLQAWRDIGALAVTFLLHLSVQCSAEQVYINDFSSGTASLTNLELVAAPLFSFDVVSGQFVINTSGIYPGPVGRLLEVLDTRNLAPRYQSALGSNSALLTWSFNLANQDGRYNNEYLVILACNNADPYALTSNHPRRLHLCSVV